MLCLVKGGNGLNFVKLTTYFDSYFYGNTEEVAADGCSSFKDISIYVTNLDYSHLN